MDEVATPRVEYVDRVGEWRLMRDSVRGETAIKRGSVDQGAAVYLPKPSGFDLPEAPAGIWEAYVERAEYPGIVSMTRSGMYGVITRKPIKVEMPTSLDGLKEKATKDGQTLEELYRVIVQEVLDVGRFGLLVDAAREGDDLPFIATYKTETILNWSEDRDFVVLDETAPQRDGFIWEDVPSYRVLELKDGRYTVEVWEEGDPQQVVIDGKITEVKELEPGDEEEPAARGGKALSEIPFVVIGTTSLDVYPDDPPLLPVARNW